MLQVAVYRAADIREHQHRAADGLEQIEVWTQAGELRARIPGEQLRRVPPRYARQPESAEGRRKLARVARKFMPELHALEADLAGLGEAGLKLRLCAQRAHVVVGPDDGIGRSEEHTSELQSHVNLVCRLLLEKKKKKKKIKILKKKKTKNIKKKKKIKKK